MQEKVHWLLLSGGGQAMARIPVKLFNSLPNRFTNNVQKSMSGVLLETDLGTIELMKYPTDQGYMGYHECHKYPIYLGGLGTRCLVELYYTL